MTTFVHHPVQMSPHDIRHHCIRLCGLEPTSTRTAILRFFDCWEPEPVGTPIGAPSRIERITVTADQCHTGEFWSLLMLSYHVSHLGLGRCMVGFE